LILPVVICLFQRLSHACLSISELIQWNCRWLIKTVWIYLMDVREYYMDIRSNSRANTCNNARPLAEGLYLLDTKTKPGNRFSLLIHNNWSDRGSGCDRSFNILPYQLSMVL